MYAALEEEFGLSRHAMAVYDRATRGVAEEDRYKVKTILFCLDSVDVSIIY